MYTAGDYQINAFDKYIYNQFLISSRTSKGKPFKIRKNFDSFDDKLPIVKKISEKLKNYPNINIVDFFNAPYFDNKDANVKLEFYATHKAISSYVKYMKHIDSLDPDDLECLKRVKESILFINSFIKDKEIKVEDYFISMQGLLPICFQHLKERRIWLYACLGFRAFDKAISNCDRDVIKLMNGDNFFEQIDFARARFYQSSRCKKLVEEMKKKLNM